MNAFFAVMVAMFLAIFGIVGGLFQQATAF
jgi:hypothetical protein